MSLKETKINVNELFEFGKCLLSEAGQKVVEIRHNDDLKTKNKVDKSVVTQADLISHQIIVHTLNAKFSNLNVVSEENSNVKNEVDVDYYMKKCDVYKETPNDFYYSSNSLTVWIDPLDATQEYTENLIEYVSLMFCIAINGEPKSGIVHRPFINKTDWSWITNSNFINDKKSPIDNSSVKRAVVSRSHTDKVETMINKYLKGTTIEKAGGSGFKVLYVARNDADFYLHTSKIYKWDLCAPNAIMNSLNGRLTDLSGKNIDFSHKTDTKQVNGLIAAANDFDLYFNAFAGKSID